MKLQEIQALELQLVEQPKFSTWRQLLLAGLSMGEAQLREIGAIQEGASTLQLPANNPHAWLATGRFAEKHGDWIHALDAYDRALALRPEDALSQFFKANVLAYLGRLDEASLVFEQLGHHYALPARTTRMGRQAWETIQAQASPPVGEHHWTWLVKPPKTVGTVVLVSLDGAYAHRYAQALLDSWKTLDKSALDFTNEAENSTAQMHLHLHLVNADASTQEMVTSWVLNAGHASVAYEWIELPDLAEDDQIDHMAQARTWYACARLRVLPWWLAYAKEGVLVTDADIRFLRSPLALWSALGQCSAGAVRFNPSGRMVCEEWYMTLALFRANPQGREIAQDLAAYVSYFLERGDGIWSLDQSALWSTFAKHGGPIGREAPTQPHVTPLSIEWVRDPNSPAYPDAILETSVASQHSSNQQALETKKAHTSQTLTAAQMWQQVAAQSVQKVEHAWKALHGTRVVAGPFAGMTYHAHSHEGCYLPKVIGTYEAEIHPFLQDIAHKQPYRKLLNIGCADGYYAVGLARLSPQLQIWACDANSQAIEATQTLAQKNGVSDRITLEHKTFTPLDFATQVEPHTLVLMDIEGGEELLLSSDALAALASADLMIEVQDCYVPGLSERLRARLEKTHQVHLFKRQNMQLSLPPEMGSWSDWDRLMAVWEMRIGPTPWLLAKARTSASTKPRQPRRKK